MATGNYGTIRPADVSPEDVQIVMVYTESRDDTQNFTLTTLDAQDVLRPYFNNQETGGSSVEILGGLYNLKLPADQFTKLGIYTLMIRPAEIRTSISQYWTQLISRFLSHVQSVLQTNRGVHGTCFADDVILQTLHLFQHFGKHPEERVINARGESWDLA